MGRLKRKRPKSKTATPEKRTVIRVRRTPIVAPIAPIASTLFGMPDAHADFQFDAYVDGGE